MTTSNGEWQYPPPKEAVYFYAWLRCDAQGENCALIPGADQKTYKLTAQDVGKRLRSRVHIRVDISPTRRVDSAPSISAPSNVVLPLPPRMSERPKVKVVGGGVIRVGAELETDRGQWLSAVAFTTAVQWLRCDIEGANCQVIAGETSDRYLLKETDRGHSFRSQVTATNSAGSTPVWSAVAPSEGAVPLQVVSESVPAGGELSSGPVSADHPLQVTVNTPVAGDVTLRVGSPTIVAPEGVNWLNSQADIDAPDAPSIENPLVLIFRYDSSIVPVGGAKVLSIYRNGVEVPACETGEVVDAETDEVVGQIAKADPCVSARATLPDGDVEVVVHTTQASVWVPAPGPDYDAEDPPTLTNVRLPEPWDGDTLGVDLGSWDGNGDGVADTIATPPYSIQYQWYRCSSPTATCNTAIRNATGSTYTLTLADRFRFVYARLTVRYNNGPQTVYNTARTPRVAGRPPQNTQTPEIFPNDVPPMEGSPLTSTVGTWDESHGLTITYQRQWQRSADDVNWVDITSATAQDYTPVAGDIGYRLRVEVTARTSLNSAVAYSASTEPVRAAYPRNLTPPHITGVAQENQTLTTSNGTWSSSVPITGYQYQWQRCDAAGVCADIGDANAQSYVLQAADIDSFIQVVVTAVNSTGGESQPSDNRPGPVLPAPPVLIENPVVSGVVQEGETIHGSDGVFSSSVPLTYSYQWLRCDAAGANCQPISGATSADYEVHEDDIDGTLRIQVTATNAGGSATGTSDPTTVALPKAPFVNGDPPVISGVTVEEQVLSVSDGSWARNPTSFSYQWLRCDLTGANCEAIVDTPDANTNQYTLRGVDVGFTMRVDVTATNSGGSTTVRTAPSAEVYPLPPVNIDRPIISGVAVEGQELSSTTGVWKSSVPLTFSFQWQRCDADLDQDGEGVNCVDVAGATAATYTAVADDAGHRLRTVVTASNAWGGTGQASSLPSETLAPLAPIYGGGATISGLEREGETLTAVEGEWSSWGELSFSYQWLRCDEALGLGGEGTNCQPVSEATQKTYVLTADDIDFRMQVVVTADNTGAQTDATAGPSRVVKPKAPVNTVLPAITAEAAGGGVGVFRDGNVLRVSDGTWTTSRPLSLTYQWLRCDAEGANCVELTATSPTYALQPEDVGYRFKAIVSADNGYVDDNYEDGAPVPAESALTQAIEASVPANQVRPTVTPSADIAVGDTLTGHSTKNDWANEPNRFTYQWQRCDVSGEESTCVDIVGASGEDLDTSDNNVATYVLTEDDLGKRMRIVVTAHNGSGSSQPEPSLVTEPVQAPPVLPPSGPATADFSGDLQETRTVTASVDDSALSGDRPFSYSYQWLRCTDATGTAGAQGDTCTAISGATEIDYVIQRVVDYQKFLQVKVTVTNDGGSLDVFSPVKGPVLAYPPVCKTDPVTGEFELCGEIRLDPADDPAALEGGTLMAIYHQGEWLSTPPISGWRYTWFRCSNTACTEVTKYADGTDRVPADPRYTLTISDIGFQIKVGITAQNNAGEGYYETLPTPVVEGRPPAMVGRPEIRVEGPGATCPDGYSLVGAPGEEICEKIEIIPAPPRCSDGVDNEQPGDGLVDYPTDPQCQSPEDDTEADPYQVPVPGPTDTEDPFYGDACNTIPGTRSNYSRAVRESTPQAYYRFNFLAPNGGSSEGWYWDSKRVVDTTAGKYIGAWIAPWGAPYPLGFPQTGAIANYANGFAYDEHTMDAFRVAATMGVWPHTSVNCTALTGYIDYNAPIFSGQSSHPNEPSYVDSRGSDPLGINDAADPNAENFTVEMWLDPQFEDRGYVFTYGTPGSNGFTLRLGNGNCNVGNKLNLTLGGVTCSLLSFDNVTRDRAADNRLYSHVVLVHTSDGWWHLYYNGQKKSAKADMKRPSPYYSFVNPPPAADPDNISTARVDEAAMYAHALTDPEIQKHYCNVPNQITNQYDHCDTGYSAPPGGTGGGTITVVPTETKLEPEVIRHTAPVDAFVGTRLRVWDGIWTGTPAITTHNRQWTRCSGEAPPLLGWGETGNGDYTCEPIAGATGETYTVTEADKNHTIRVEVVAESGYGRAPTQRHRQTGVSGTFADDGIGVSRAWPTEAEPGGQIIDAQAPDCELPTAFVASNNDAVQSTPPSCQGYGLVYSSPSWLICDSAGANCGAELPGPILISQSDPQDTARVIYTVSNTYGSVTLTSTPVSLSGLPSECLIRPRVGDTIPGAAICGDYTVVWPNGTGAVAPTRPYTIQASDEGKMIVYPVTRNNKTAYVRSRAVPRASAPFFDPAVHQRPSIVGPTVAGSTVYAFWAPGAAGHEGEMNPCDTPGVTCEWFAELGDQAPTYQQGDTFQPNLEFLGVGSQMTIPQCTIEIDPTCTPLEGKSVVLRVTYSDGIYEQSPYSEPTGLTKPVNTQLPVRPVAQPTDPTGTPGASYGGTKPVPGKQLAGNVGTWTGSSPMTFSIQWQSSLDDGQTWVNHGAPQAANVIRITLTDADLGKRFRYVVTANNSLTGPGTPDPNGVAAVSPATDPVEPQIAPEVKQTVDGPAKPTWLNCSRNAVHGWPGCSDFSHLTGNPQSGTDLQGRGGSEIFTGSVPASGFTFTRQWQRCQVKTLEGDPTGLDCTPGSNNWANAGPASDRYQLTDADVGYIFRYKLTASNASGSATAVSDPTGVVFAAPVVNQTPPSFVIARGYYPISFSSNSGQPITTDIDGNPITAPEPGMFLLANTGFWSGTSPISYTYLWESSLDGGETWVADGTSSSVRTMTIADLGKLFRLTVTASNPSSSASASGGQTGEPVQSAPPVLVSPPTITGTVIQGSKLTVTNGSWRSNVPITYTYQWIRCDHGGLNCFNINGQTNNQYTLTSIDIGQTIKARVTANNASDAVSEEAGPTARVFAAAPVVNAAPSVNVNIAAPGDTVETDGGAFSSSVSFSLTYQWQRAEGDSTDWVDIAGATDPSYLVQLSDTGYSLRVRVTATNDTDGNLDTDAFSSRVVVGDANTYRSAVFADGAELHWRLDETYPDAVGQAMLDSIGALNGTYNRGGNMHCSGCFTSTVVMNPPLVGQTDANQAVVAGNRSVEWQGGGKADAAIAAPTLSDGTGTDTTAEFWMKWDGTYSAAAFNGGPRAIVAFSISGNANAGNYSVMLEPKGSQVRFGLTTGSVVTYGLDMDPGVLEDTWHHVVAVFRSGSMTASKLYLDGQPLSLQTFGTVGSHTLPATGTINTRVSGHLINNGCLTASCDVYNGATPTYFHGKLDEVSLYKGALSAERVQAHYALAEPAPTAPVNRSAPTVTGVTLQGETLTANPGYWVGTRPLSYTYQWQRCSSAGGSCANISGATSQTYTLQAADVGSTVRVLVVASNAGGTSDPTASAPSPVVVGNQSTAPPTLTGEAKEGRTLQTDNGGWGSLSPTNYAYQWQVSSDSGATWSNLAGAIDNRHFLPLGAAGKVYRVKVYAYAGPNPLGVAISDPTVVVASGAPELTAPLTVTGTAKEGEALSVAAENGVGVGGVTDSAGASHGTYSGSVAIGTESPLPSGYGINLTGGNVDLKNGTILGNANMTIEAWIKITGTNSYRRYIYVEGLSASPWHHYGLALTPAGQLEFYWQGSSSESTVGPYVNDGQWHHVAATKNGTAVTLYVDGAQVATGSALGTMNTPVKARAGDFPEQFGSSTRAYKGLLDEVSVYQTALSASAVAAHYTARADASAYATAVSGDAPAGYWRFDNGVLWLNGPYAYTYQWQRGDGTSWTDVANATAKQYSPTSADVGSQLRVRVVAYNRIGSDTATSEPAYSDPTGAVVTGVPVLTGAIGVGGLAKEGEVLTAEATTYANPDEIPPPSVPSTFVSSPSFDDNVPAGLSSTFAGWTKSGNGSGAAACAAACYEAGYGPQHGSHFAYLRHNTNFSGTSGGTVLTSDAFTASGGDITFYGRRTKVFDAADVASRMKVEVLDGNGSVLRTPFNDTLPGVEWTKYTISMGVADEGQQRRLRITGYSSIQGYGVGASFDNFAQGTSVSSPWLNDPHAFTYQWQRGDGTTWTDIPNATGKTYVPRAADVGQRLRYRVVAYNYFAGASRLSTTYFSAASDVVAGGAPAATTSPSVSGSADVGQILTVDQGVWSNSPYAYTYQWQRNDGSGWVDIAGATGMTYFVTAADRGHDLRAAVTAYNALGSGVGETTASSASLAVPAGGAATPANYEASILADAPRGYWKLDEASGTTAADSSGNGIAGTYTNSPTLGATSLKPSLGTAVSFSGTQYVSGLSSSQLNLTSGNNTYLSVEAWVKTTHNNATVTHIFGAYNPVSPFTGYALGLISGRPAFWDGGAWRQAGSTGFIADGQWHHVVVTHTGAVANFYIDGVLNTSVAGTPIAVYSGQKAIGARADGATAFIGSIDEVAVYAYALNKTEVAEHFAAPLDKSADGAGYEAAVNASTPSSYWKFDEASGATQAADSAGAFPLTYQANAITGQPGALPGVAKTSFENPLGDTGGTAVYPGFVTTATNNLSFEFWVHPKAQTTTKGHLIFYNGHAGADGYGLILANSACGAGMQLDLLMGGLTCDATGSTVILSTDRWYHVALTRSSADNVWRLYLNGALVATSTTTPRAPGSQGQGGNTTFSEPSFTGLIDEGAYFNRSLSAFEVQEHYTAAGYGPEAASAPVNTVAPQLKFSGSAPKIGEKVVADVGTWLHSPSFTYSWYACNLGTFATTNVPWVTVPANASTCLRLTVNASNSKGTTSATTAQTTAPISGVAAVSVAPRLLISGSNPRYGEVAVADVGSWTNKPSTFRYEWYSCNIGVFASTTTPTLVVPANVGSTCLAVRVIATNAYGDSSPQSSANSAGLVSAVPVNTVQPEFRISAPPNPHYGEVAVADAGSWSGEPSSFRYEWSSCNIGVFASTTTPTLVVPANVGSICLSVRVFAQNGAGETQRSANNSGSLANPSPSIIAAPQIQGTAQVGNVLSVDVGNWNYAPTSFTVEWQNASTGVTVATGPTYTPTSSFSLRARVTATNSFGSGTATSASVTVAP